jgi:glyceraldehyde-3-phosphate dehydrogenase [NAD(P)+]
MGPMPPPELVTERPRFQTLLEDRLFKHVIDSVDDGIPTFRNYIAGTWRRCHDYTPLTTPIDGSVVAKVPQADDGEIGAAIDSAWDRRRTIRDMPGHRRIEVFDKASDLLLEHRDALREALLLEAGKTRHDQDGETGAASERMRATRAEAGHIYGDYLPGDWSSDTVGKMSLVIREPLGVVGCISPFNYPLFIPTAKITPALLAGNTVVAKSSITTPVSLLLLARILEEAGLPPGVLNVLTGHGSGPGEALVSSPKVRLISFTGSTTVGKKIHEISGLKKLHLELGGKAHAIVLDDADVPLAAAKSVEGMCKNAGQRCDAVSAAVVIDSVKDAFVDHAVKACQAWQPGDPRRPGVKMGPMIGTEPAKRVEAMIKEAVKQGAQVVTGGTRHDAYLEPTVLTDVKPEMKVARHEIFGPVLPIMSAADETEALDVATSSPYGLDSCVFTQDFGRMWRVVKRLNTGMVTINDLPKHGIGHFPFGGQRESGLGREGIGYSIDLMTELKTIVFTLGPRTP